MEKDKIINRIYIKGTLELTSPLILGSGEDEISDIDLVRDYEGKPFIPGSSIAGAIRHYLDEILSKDGDKENKLIRTFFGEREKESTMSLISLYDAYPSEKNTSKPEITLRDGVRIDNITGTAENEGKFEYEIMEPGAEFDFKSEVIIRENHCADKDKLYNLIYLILKALEEEKISFGAKTRRGFGKMKLKNLQILSLDMSVGEEAEKWLNFDWPTMTGNMCLNNFPQNLLVIKHNLTKIEAKFSIPYSILIRHYTVNPKDPDHIHLTSNNKPIISGPSWSGVIRHTIKDIGRTLNKSGEVDNLIFEMFGYANDRGDDYPQGARASRVYINESIIENGKFLSYTRNKVDRFTGGVVSTALFEEKPYYGGQVTLNIAIKDAKPYEIGLIILALKDIGNGISPVGGAGNIGRGILEIKEIKLKPDIILFDGNNWNKENTYLKKLANKLKEVQVVGSR